MKQHSMVKSFYKKAVEILPIVVFAVDETGKLCVFNEAAQNVLQIPPDAYDRDFSAICPSAEIVSLINKAVGGLKRIVNLNERFFLCHSFQIDDKVFTGCLIIMTDVTEMEHIKLQLLEAQGLKDELDTIIQASFDYIFVTDGKGNVLKLNDSYTRITGIKADEVLGKNIYDLVKAGFYNRAATIEVIEHKKTTTFTQTVKTGKMVLVTGNPVFDANGELVRVVTNGRDITELYNLKQEIEQAQHLRQHYQRELQKMQSEGSEDYIVASPKMFEIWDLINRIAKADSTILISGESGVGKEIVAREIHRNSMRSDKPYISLNCAAIPDNLIESELFGYEAGAFTGALRKGKMGIFQVANGGTLLLDEIGEMPFYLQAKLLRVIQENEIIRVGGTKPIPINVRLITATNRNLWQMVQEGKFRQDFYYRLNVVQVQIPPIRERKEEITVFVDYFIGLLNKKYILNKRLDPLLLKRLVDYDWPGNVREIKNTIEQAFVTSPGQIISEIRLGPHQKKCVSTDDQPTKNPVLLKEALQEYESQLIREAIKSNGSSRKAAAVLGVSQATIWRKAMQYGIKLSGE